MKLGYTFRSPALLEQALSHKSVGRDNNERLEFLGDSLVNFFIAEALFERFPDVDEGVMSRLRASLVKKKTLAAIACELGVPDELRLGPGEMKSGGHRRASIQADALEAIIAAIYLDSDFLACRDVVRQWFAARLE